MNIVFTMVVSSAVALSGLASLAYAQSTDEHKMATPQEIKWAAGLGVDMTDEQRAKAERLRGRDGFKNVTERQG